MDCIRYCFLFRFAEDERMKEVCRLLRSSKTQVLKVERTPEATDATHRQKQQLRLLALCRRSLGLSVGRGMLTLASLDPLMAEHLPIPPLSLSGMLLLTLRHYLLNIHQQNRSSSSHECNNCIRHIIKCC